MHGDGVGLQPPVDRGGCREPHGGLYRPRPQGDSWPQRHAHGARDKRGTHHRNSTLQGGTWSLRHTVHVQVCALGVLCRMSILTQCMFVRASVCVVYVYWEEKHSRRRGGRAGARWGWGSCPWRSALGQPSLPVPVPPSPSAHTHIRNVMYTYKYTEKCVCVLYCTDEHHDVLPMCMCVCLLNT